MRLLAPFGLAAAALSLPLVLWYVLRSRRPAVTVASTLLWRRTDSSVAAAVPWQRFRPDRTFWLVLLALLAGTLALARPALPVETMLGDHTVVIVDVSASMLADEGGSTRLELARREAEALVGDLGPGQTVSVVSAGPSARILLSHGTDASAAANAIRRISPSEGGAALADAFRLALALDRPGRATRHHLFTDGVLPADAVAAAPPGLTVHSLGEDRPNLAVTRLEAVSTGGGAVRVFAQVRNFGMTPAAARLRVSIDGSEVAQVPVRLDLRGLEDVIVPAVAGGGAGLVEAWVEPLDGEGAAAVDALALDDRARALLRGGRTVTVLLATPGNVFLEQALAAVDGVDVRVVATVPAELAGVDLLVADRVTVPLTLDVPALLVAPARLPDGITADAAVELPTITFQSAEHPLMADVDLSATAVAEATPLRAPALETVAAGPDGPLLLAGRLGAAPVVALGFDLLRSNLPLQVAWPVLVSNAVAWLTAPPAAQPLLVGEELRFSVPPGVAAVAVDAPSGETIRVDAARPRLVVDRAGLWTATWVPAEGAGEAVERLRPPPAVPVNVPPDEGDLARPRPEDSAAGADQPGAAGAVTATVLRDVGRPLLIAALVLLVGEWLWAARPPRPRARDRRGRRGRSPATAPAAGSAGGLRG